MARGRLAEEEAIARDLGTDDEGSETEMASHSRRESNFPWGFRAPNYYNYNYLSLGGECTQNMEQHRGRAALQ